MCGSEMWSDWCLVDSLQVGAISMEK
jgi:hypothetical protein